MVYVTVDKTLHITERMTFMGKMTELGLELIYDESKSAPDNFYRQVFGRWPETEYAWKDTHILETIIGKSVYGNQVAEFFGLGVERQTLLSQTKLENVANGLSELRQKYTAEIVALYEFGANQTEQAFERLLKLYMDIRVQQAEMGNRSRLAELFPKYYKEINEAVPLEALELPSKAYNALDSAGIKTVESLVRNSGEDLMKLEHIGRKGLDYIERALAEHDLYLANAKPETGAEIRGVRLIQPRAGNTPLLGAEPVEVLGFSTRINSRLQRSKIYCVGELLDNTAADLFQNPELETRDVDSIILQLLEQGLYLK